MRTPIASWLRRLDALTPAAASTLGLVLGAAAAATLLTRGSSIVGVVAFVALLALVGALAWSGGGWRSAPTLSLTVAPLPPTQSAITVHLAVSTRPKVRPDNAPRSAYASFASADRDHVMARIRSVQVATGMDVFLDCLSIRPGELWKESLREEIRRRDVFWLFWSRHAAKSEWVDWEWRTALAEKTIRGIQPCPLESADLAPPPPELADLDFGGLYEQMLLSLGGQRNGSGIGCNTY
jgi:hypothetical protein